MTDPIHVAAPPYVNRNLFRVGMLPRSEQIQAAMASFQHMRTFGRNRQIAAYYGRNSKTTNGNLASVFYPITGFPVISPTNTAYVGGALKLWQFDCGGSPLTQLIQWYKEKSDGSPEDSWSTTINWSADQDPVEIPQGGTYTLGYSSVTPSASNDGFVASKLVATNCVVAGLGLWSLPEKTLTDAKLLNIISNNFDPGETIRGYDADAGTSVGAILHAMHHESTSNLSTWHYSRRCLFQTPFPTGLYAENTDEFNWPSFYNMFPSTADGSRYFAYQVQPRNLTRSTSNIRTQPAMVLSTSGADCVVRFRSVTAGDTWTYTSTGADSTALITPSDGSSSDSGALAIDPDGDTVVIEAQLEVDDWVLFHTLSLWEWPNYDEESTVS